MADQGGGVPDESEAAALDAPHAAKLDATPLGGEIASRAAGGLEDVLVESFPSDGEKLTLTRGRRRLNAYFFGDGRFIYGERRWDPEAPLGEGGTLAERRGRRRAASTPRWPVWSGLTRALRPAVNSQFRDGFAGPEF
jgi:hypothetical protein